MTRKRAIKIAVIAVVIAVIVLYFSVNPATNKFFPRCIIQSITGYRCPGCGSQRVIHSLLHGDIRAAIGYNAFLVFAIPLIVLYLLNDYTKLIPAKFGKVLTHPATLISLLVAVFLWWVLRNVFGW
ncbi:MAG: DUF2752 domain-containing protein [Muribaculaceae bacterium]|nr:DUF2752 domain-containing protein [Muribaculaceae bacterium]